MEQQVIAAARTLLHPNSTPTSRSTSSANLEQWTRTAQSWNNYLTLLPLVVASRCCDDANNGNGSVGVVDNLLTRQCGGNKKEVTGVSLLLLTMFHAKIRREFSRRRGDENDDDNGDVANNEKSVRMRDGVRDGVMAALERLQTTIRRNEDLKRRDDDSKKILSQLCSVLAAIAVRYPRGGGGIPFFLYFARRTTAANVADLNVSLRLLVSLPEEWEVVDKSVKEKEELSREMRAGLGDVFELVKVGLVGCGGVSGAGGECAVLSLKIMRNWVAPCNITLSELYKCNLSAPNGCYEQEQNNSLLSALVQILSLPDSPNEAIPITAAKALTECLLQKEQSPSLRTEPIRHLLRSIPKQGFLVTPYNHHATPSSSERDDNISHALILLASTIANEEMEDLVLLTYYEGSSELFNLLLRAQSHPSASVALLVFDTWLTLSEIPTMDRHPDCGPVLFRKVLRAVVEKIAYPVEFVTWEEELDLDSQDFEEVRRMGVDVLVSCYFLLRVAFVDELLLSMHQRQNYNGRNDGNNQSPPWNVVEAVLFCLSSVSREMCQHVVTTNKSRMLKKISGDNTAKSQETMQRLIALTKQLLSCGGITANSSPAYSAAQVLTKQHHPYLVASVCRYLGSYAPVWNAMCSDNCDNIIEIIAFLRASLELCTAAVTESAKSIKLILVACSSPMASVIKRDFTTLSVNNNDNSSNTHLQLQLLQNHALVTSLLDTMDKALGSNDEDAMLFVAEGCTRLCVQLKDAKTIQLILLHVVSPVWRRLQMALDAIRQLQNHNDAAQLEHYCHDVAHMLRVTKEVIRFCDDGEDVGVLTNVLNIIWPLLTTVASFAVCRQHDYALEQLLAVHSQLISAVPKLLEPYLADLITFVVQAFEETRLPCTLDTVGGTVEYFGQNHGMTDSFAGLLSHLTRLMVDFVTREIVAPDDCPQLIRAYFDMAKRYLLFCPLAIIDHCADFPTIFSFAVACLTQCQGERDSTRSTLNFLSQLLSLNILNNTSSITNTAIIDSSLHQNGQLITTACISGLTGSLPQPLWPSISECLYSLLSRTLMHAQNQSLARTWVATALSSGGEENCVTPELQISITNLLIGLVTQERQKGRKMKPMVKMLLDDFGKICKGEMSVDSLLSYELSS